MRDVALSIGHFRVAHADSANGVAVTVGVAEGIADIARDLCHQDRAPSWSNFSARFGPYPWPAYTVAITPGLLPAASSIRCHVMQGPGTIGRTTTHEVAHQWFYGLVGNDQGARPVARRGAWPPTARDGAKATR